MRKIILLILDGWGLAPAWGGNAISMAETPNMDRLWKEYPHTQLLAAEEAVGLPEKEPGNSEVGHLNIGSGQIVYQNLPGINAVIADGSFFKNEVLLSATKFTQKNDSNMHLLGLVSDGGIHSYNGHLYALLELAKYQGVKNVFIHMITDGRDTEPMSALSYLRELQDKIKEIGLGKVASISGRYYAMDRDNHWDRTQSVYDLLTSGIGESFPSAEKAIAESYRQNKSDEFIQPVMISDEKNPFTPIKDGDAVVFFNFRSERARQLTESFIQDDFRKFHCKKKLENIFFATFAFLEEYAQNKNIKIVFHERKILHPLAQILSEKGLKQFHIAETEKYAHVTFFFNGGIEKPFSDEDRVLVPSPSVATYDLKPEMSAKEVAKKVIEKFNHYDFTVCNFANLDMVGHTGKIKAVIRAAEEVDSLVGKITEAALKNKALVIITADHGNAEEMINPKNNEPYTEHTINPVPFILCSDDPALKKTLKNTGKEALKDIAPTILKLMDIADIPAEMTGVSLVE